MEYPDLNGSHPSLLMSATAPPRIVNPMDEYHLRTIRFQDITDDMVCHQTHVTRAFWTPHPQIIDALGRKLTSSGMRDRIVDLGAGWSPFPYATHLLDWNHTHVPGKSVFQVDLDYDPLPFSDQFFSFAYSRHTLEDIQNPLHAFKEIVRVSAQGYIETPSPLIEVLRGVDGCADAPHRGYYHHRYIIWSDPATHTLHVLPKYPMIEYFTIHTPMLRRLTYLANHYPVYWNNYYVWDFDNPPRILVYRNDINMKLENGDYWKLLNQSILTSIEHTNHFIPLLRNILQEDASST